MAGSIKLQKDDYLFKEGDPSDAMYVVKSGRLVVTKPKQNSEIVLAEIGPGSMVGEMAFFDNKPRSASVKAIQSSEVIALPFVALHKQFATFPEWCKAIMRTVNDHLRNANKRIKELEKIENEQEMFPPHTITKLISILNLVGNKYGQANEKGQLTLHSNRLRTYTIQVFQQPTHKMEKLTEVLSDLELIELEDTGDGFKKIHIRRPEILFAFVEWYNDWLFKREEERITLSEQDLPFLKGYIHFAKKQTKDASGNVKISVTQVQNDSMKELGYLVKKEESYRFIEKGWMGELVMENDELYSTFNFEDLEKMIPFWELLYKLQRFSRAR